MPTLILKRKCHSGSNRPRVYPKKEHRQRIKEQTEFVFPQAAKLTLAEAELIETFLAQRLDIPPDTRRQNSQRIAELLIARLGTLGDARPADDEDFLELVLKEFRNRAKYR